MRNRTLLIAGIGIIIGLVLGAAGVVLAGGLNPIADPTAPGSQMYTLQQIYDRLASGAAGTKMTAFTEPSSGPSAGTMHTLDEVMAVAPAVDAANGATAADVALAAGDISGYAWGTAAGWINFAPDNGGVTVYDDHLEGYAWGENIGWIRLGTCTGGSSCTHANTSAGSYGVNNDGVGNLSGYAWGATAGWINFDPDGAERVTIDPITGDFSGYAWGENIGWIHFANASPAYKVNTAWRPTILPPVGNIDPENNYAWGTAAGWINFAPDNGGVSVYDDHLEGYAWGENIGWIRLGTHTGGGSHTYTNADQNTYGVNRDTNTGALSGYAWSTTAGWINFAPTSGGVTVSEAGEFSGYAWGENIGWTKFDGTAQNSTTYKVSTVGPVAVTLAFFDAQQVAGHVLVTWESVSESNNAGFNLYRSASAAGPLTLLAHVPAQAPGSTQGAAYRYEDLDVQPGQTWWYTLEDVELDGATTRHEPVVVTVGQPNAVGLAGFGATAAGPSLAALAGLAALALVALAGAGLRRRWGSTAGWPH